MAVKVNIVNMPNIVKQSGLRIRTQLGVLHSAECPLKRGYPMSLTQWTIDTAVQASWHEFVGPGVVVQSVHSDYIAWHASVANWISWGTEQTGYAAYTRAQWLSKDGRDQLERVAMQWAGDAKYFGWDLSDLRWLPTSTVRAIVAGNDTTTKGFCTHAQVDPASRTDPGPNYPYEYLLERIKHYYHGPTLQISTLIQIGDEDVPDIKDTSRNQPIELTEGEWETLPIVDDADALTLVGGGTAGVFNASATFNVSGLPAGQELHVRFVEADYVNGGKLNRTYRTHEVIGTGGGSYSQFSQNGQLSETGHRLRVQVKAFSPGVKIEGWSSSTLYWRP